MDSIHALWKSWALSSQDSLWGSIHSPIWLYIKKELGKYKKKLTK